MWNKELYVREQQDAYEFFTSLVDQLDEHLKVRLTRDSFFKHVKCFFNHSRWYKPLTIRKWVESRSSKTHFREFSQTRRFVKTVLTGEFVFIYLFIFFINHLVFKTHYSWCSTVYLFVIQIRAWRNIHGFESWSNFLSKLGNLIRPVCQRRGVGGQQRLLLWEMQGEGPSTALVTVFHHTNIWDLSTNQCLCLCICTEDHGEEDMHQIPAQRSLYSPHALWLWLGKWALHQIWWTDPGMKLTKCFSTEKHFLILDPRSQNLNLFMIKLSVFLTGL